MILAFLAGRDAHPRKPVTPAFWPECEGCKPVRRVRESDMHHSNLECLTSAVGVRSKEDMVEVVERNVRAAYQTEMSLPVPRV